MLHESSDSLQHSRLNAYLVPRLHLHMVLAAGPLMPSEQESQHHHIVAFKIIFITIQKESHETRQHFLCMGLCNSCWIVIKNILRATTWWCQLWMLLDRAIRLQSGHAWALFIFYRLQHHISFLCPLMLCMCCRASSGGLAAKTRKRQLALWGRIHCRLPWSPLECYLVSRRLRAAGSCHSCLDEKAESAGSGPTKKSLSRSRGMEENYEKRLKRVRLYWHLNDSKVTPTL